MVSQARIIDYSFPSSRLGRWEVHKSHFFKAFWSPVRHMVPVPWLRFSSIAWEWFTFASGFFFLLYPRKCPSVSIKKWPPGNWNPSKHLTEITWDIPNDNFSAETLLNSWPTKITRDNNCVGGKPPCFGEICCTTIITDRNFGTRGETLLKQKPIKMDNCCGLDGKWKLEGPWSDC